MKAKHVINQDIPLNFETFSELRKGLISGNLDWDHFPKELKNAYHNFEALKRETDFENELHEETSKKIDIISL